eukprot:TRINITY_DN679_c0_g1_i1.p1 TRINITY_DN679_c0_g1~~TRINITY_DN679_c0_g1_i1.p1  ORF type:complete len:609 (-),score=130.65 TRINITY_DN679_c0_g1_i1:30-1856(-)
MSKRSELPENNSNTNTQDKREKKKEQMIHNTIFSDHHHEGVQNTVKLIKISRKYVEVPKELISFEEISEYIESEFSPSTYKKFLKQEVEKDLPDAYRKMGLYHSQQGNIEKAVNYIRIAAQKGDRESHRILGNWYFNSDQYDLSIQHYRIVIENGDCRPYSYLGIIEERRGNFDQAVEYYKVGISLGDSRSSVNLGMLYEEWKEYDKAKECYEVAIKQGNGQAMFQMGICQDDDAEKEKYLKMSIEHQYDTALYVYGLMLFEKGDKENGRIYLDKAVEAGIAEAYYTKGVILERDSYTEALRLFDVAFKEGVDIAAYGLGEMFFSFRDFANALTYLALGAKKGIGYCLNSIGNLMHELELDSKAEAFFGLAMTHDCCRNAARYNLAIHYYERGNIKEAENMFRSIEQENSFGLTFAGIFFMELENYSEAQEFFKKALSSGSKEARHYMGIVELKKKNTGKASEIFLEGIRLEKDKYCVEHLRQMNEDEGKPFPWFTFTNYLFPEEFKTRVLTLLLIHQRGNSVLRYLGKEITIEIIKQLSTFYEIKKQKNLQHTLESLKYKKLRPELPLRPVEKCSCSANQKLFSFEHEGNNVTVEGTHNVVDLVLAA